MQSVLFLKLLVPVSPQVKDYGVIHYLIIGKNIACFEGNWQKLTIVILKYHKFVL